MVLIMESKRDDLLLPYLNILKEKGIEKSLGQFKTEMLEKLAAQGCINNLSQSSNYYLAGATKYYFQGLLTNGTPSYLESGDVKKPDVWNEDVCVKLNALVQILRNAYIDTVGTQFEQPEDFGELSLPKLLRKYNKKINAALGIEDKKKEAEPELDTNPNVGNGYTFDILYSYADATKYNRYTAPGAWCITYGQGHYDNYIRMFSHYGGIHYVIFLKNGYENVPRKIGPGYTRQKPHDEYGNSMIAFLQRNDCWEPTYITSRWNHGYENDTSGTNADHAYDLEEFCNITGVSVDDLKRIYQIWKTNAKNVTTKTSASEKRQLAIEPVRKIKYAQMRANGGESLFKCLTEAGAYVNTERPLFGNGEEKKSVVSAKLGEFSFIIDKGKVVFDSIIFDGDLENMDSSNDWYGTGEGESPAMQNMVIIKATRYWLLYNVRQHAFLEIDGQKKFKCIPERARRWHRPSGVSDFYEVKLSGKDIALVSTRTNMPLKMPNGSCWFNKITYPGVDERWERGNELHAHFIGPNSQVLKLVADESSGESYFYSMTLRRFVDFPDASTNNEDVQQGYYSPTTISDPKKYRTVIYPKLRIKGYFAVAYSSDKEYEYDSVCTSPMLYKSDCTRAYIYGKGKFVEMRENEGMIMLSSSKSWNRQNRVYYDPRHKKMVAIENRAFMTNENGDFDSLGGRYIKADAKNHGPICGLQRPRGASYLVYDTQEGCFVKNIWEEAFMGTPFFSSDIDGEDNGFSFIFDGWDFWDYIRAEDREYKDGREEEVYHKIFVTDGVAYKNTREHGMTAIGNIELFPNTLPVNDENYHDEHSDDIPSPENNFNFPFIQGQLSEGTNEEYMILNESKRDDLLLPYLKVLNEKGINLSLGRFKGIMLDKLAAQGGMHNLSKASNFYLAGAVRYYFNGDLTLNKDLSVLTGDPSATDQWNTEVCYRLDALIDILRTSYIDSVGETMEQPEDFGNLPIEKLLKKYNRKINAYLGIDDGTSKKKKESEPEVVDTNVGNDYTFHILYSYPDGTKYERFTAPGAWCITYGKNHYDGYIRRLNIHYVIFLKEGYENVKRQVGPGFTKRKPHDAYGNSMIALLQSNIDGSPVFITSRWNHGYGETSGTEADHAYTPEEFYQITGVTPEDLQRIFQIWKKEAPKHKENGKKTVDPAEKARKLENLRSLKYIQMRINGGEDPNALLKPYQMLYGKMPERDEDGVVRQKVDFRKCVLICSPMPQGEERPREYFLVDKGQIIFETISEGRPQWDFTMMPAEKFYQNRDGAQDASDERGVPHNLIIFKGNGGGYGLYDTRKHAFITVGGTKRFKSIPNKWSDTGARYMPQFFQVKMSINDIALISLSNNMPLKLPNGEYWFNDMKSNKIKGNSESYYRSLDSYFAGTLEDGLIEIIYDISSGEKYFYSTSQKKFVDLSYVLQYVGDDNLDNLYLNTKERQKILGKYDAVTTMRGTDRWNIGPTMFIDGAGQIEKLGEFDKFGDFDEQGRLLCIAPVEKKENGNWGTINDGANKRVVFNKEKGLVLKSGGNYVFVQGISHTYSDSPYAVLSQYIRDENNRSWTDCKLLYDIDNNALLKNPFGYPSDYLFEAAGVQGREFMRVYKKPHRTFGWSERDTRNTEFAECVSDVYYDELEKTPLDDNNEQGNEYRVDNAQAAPAQALAETISLDEIKLMVNEAIRRIRDGK